jgi:hypothetical protein
MKLDDYLEKGENLPEIMKDFHDQKDLFKTIFQQFEGSHPILEKVSWVDGQIFTIDVFLWWMGRHGYKLQKIRKKDVTFHEPEDTIKYFKDKRNHSLADLLKKDLDSK